MAATDEWTSIPALLARNARLYAGRPAWREKEFGIWQSWTWAEGAAEIRGIALGFLALGLNRRAIAKLCGCSPNTFYRWLQRRRPELLAASGASVSSS